uniref:Sodium/hydrogen exchanger n=1 Tax=Panagrolaimus sp. JU765 TaxID=591449 RepID=A0AC34RJ13_9BILA
MKPYYLAVIAGLLIIVVNSAVIKKSIESFETTEPIIFPDNATLSSLPPLTTTPQGVQYDEEGKIICDSSDMLDHRTSTPPRILVVALVALLLLIKTIAKVHPKITKIMPESALFVAFGLFTGVPIGMYYPTTFNPDHFFDFLLPVIVLEASFSVSNSDLMENVVKISTFAVLGTILNTVLIAGALIALSGYFVFAVGSGQLILFATVLSAVDPVAVISVFEDVGVNALLYVNVFGESLVNDGVSVVLFRAVKDINSTGQAYSLLLMFMTILDFLKSAICGCFLGLIGALATGFATRITHGLSIVQPIYVIFIPYSVYLIAENYHVSGIIALMFCVIMMKVYTKINLSHESTAMTEFLLKSGSSVSESYIFMYLGICTYQVIWTTDVFFCFSLICICFFARFIETFLLCFFLNLVEYQKLRFVDQFVMAYSGLRGAVCYGLVMSLDTTDYPCKKYFASAAISIVLSTIFIQGVTIKWIVLAMRVKLADAKEDTRFEITTKQVISHLMNAVSAASGRPFMSRYLHHIVEAHDQHLAKYLMVCDPAVGLPNKSAIKITAKHEELEKEEAYERFRKCGSFAVLPTQLEDAVIRKSQSMVQPPPSQFFQERTFEPVIEEPEPLTIAGKTLPRNLSDRKLLNAIFEGQNTVHKNMYSRYFTGNRPSVMGAFDDIEEDEEPMPTIKSQSRYNTIPNPYCQNPAQVFNLGAMQRQERAMTMKGGKRNNMPDRPRSQNQQRHSPTRLQVNRPTFVMGNDEHNDDDTGLITHTTGRFRVTTKSSPSHSAASQEAESLIKKTETEF